MLPRPPLGAGRVSAPPPLAPVGATAGFAAPAPTPAPAPLPLPGLLPPALWPLHPLHMTVARLYAVHIDRGLVSSPDVPETSHFLYSQHPLTRAEISGTVTEVRILSGGERMAMVVDDGTGSTQAVMYLVNQDGSATHHAQPAIGDLVSVAGRLGWGYRSGSAGGGRCREISVVSSVRRLGSLEELCAAWAETARLHLEEYSQPVSAWLAGLPPHEAQRWDAPPILKRRPPPPAVPEVGGAGGAAATPTPAQTEGLAAAAQTRQQRASLLDAALEGAVLGAVAEHGMPAALEGAVNPEEEGEGWAAAPAAAAAPPRPPSPPLPPAAQQPMTLGSLPTGASNAETRGEEGAAAVADEGGAAAAAESGEGASAAPPREFTLASLTCAVRDRLPADLLRSFGSAPAPEAPAAAEAAAAAAAGGPSSGTLEDRVAASLAGLFERGVVYVLREGAVGGGGLGGVGGTEAPPLPASRTYGPITAPLLRAAALRALQALAAASTPQSTAAGGARGGRAAAFAPPSRGWAPKDVAGTLAAALPDVAMRVVRDRPHALI